jgi:hypothetical protein
MSHSNPQNLNSAERQADIARRSRRRCIGLLIVMFLAIANPPVLSMTWGKEPQTKPFKYSIKRPFPFHSQTILKLPENDFVDTWHVIFTGWPNFFEVTVGFMHKGPVDPKRIITAQIQLLDEHGKTIASQTYKCPDARVNDGQQVMPGIRSSGLQSIDLSHCDKGVRDQVAEVRFVFSKL